MTTYRMNSPSAHIDRFAQDNLPPVEDWPEFRFTLPELQYAPRLNAARVLADDAIAEGYGAKPAVYQDSSHWTYEDLVNQSSRIAHVLVKDEGLVPGNRVCWRRQFPCFSPLLGSPSFGQAALQYLRCRSCGRRSWDRWPSRLGLIMRSATRECCPGRSSRARDRPASSRQSVGEWRSRGWHGPARFALRPHRYGGG